MPARELRGCAVVFVLGGPGSGKGTQSQMVAQRYGGWAHLSTGELLKAEAATGSEQGMEIESYIGDGKMVPVEITIGLTKAAMQESDATKFLIDGFPREKSQVNLFEEQVGASFESIIAFTAPDEVLQERILKRGENASSGRTDDNLETLQKRLNTYQTFTVPVIECFRGSGKLHEVSAVGSPEEVFVQVSKIIEGVEARIAECAKSSTGGTAPNGAGALGSSHERLEATAVERGSEVAEMKTTQEAPQSKDSAKNTQCGQVLQNGKQKANTMPTRQYMDETVVPVLREGLRALNVARPTDPLQFLADFLISYKKKLQEGENG